MSVQPHPVAALLTDEMRERVRAATFVRVRHAVRAMNEDGYPVCPLGFALGMERTPSYPAMIVALGVGASQPGASVQARVDIHDFAYMADTGEIAPEDVKALLGVES